MRIKASGLKPLPRRFCIVFAFLPFYLGMTILPIASSVMDNILDYWLIFALLLLIGNELKIGIRIDRFKVFCLLYFVVIIVSTVINGGDFMRMIKIIACIMMIILLTDYAVETEYSFFVSFLSKLTIAVTILNIFSIIFFPGGFSITSQGRALADRYLLGMDNRFCCTLFPGFCFVLLNDIRGFGRIKLNSWIEYGLLLFTFAYTKAIGSLLSVLVILPILLIINTRFAKKIFHGLSYFIVQTVLAFLITFVRIFERMALILGYFGKDVTLTSRTYIWNKANYYIESHKVIGMGIESNEDVISKFSLVHLHNQLLTIIYQTGYIGLVSFLAIAADIYYKLFKSRKELEAQVVALILFLLFIQLLTDTVDNVRNHLFWMMAIGANIEIIIENNKAQKTIKQLNSLF